MSLSQIDTIVILIMENRSFDHMLGYLSAENILAVDGIKKDTSWLERYANPSPSNRISPHPLASAFQIFADPQHHNTKASFFMRQACAQTLLSNAGLPPVA